MIPQAKGFSLLEILVAFAIMAVAITIVLRIFSSGVNTAIISEEYSVAMQIAESLMVGTGVETPLAPGEAEGTEVDKYHWLVTVRPLAISTNNGQNNSAQHLYSVKVQVSWDDGRGDGSPRTIELNSLKSQLEQ